MIKLLGRRPHIYSPNVYLDQESGCSASVTVSTASCGRPIPASAQSDGGDFPSIAAVWSFQPTPDPLRAGGTEPEVRGHHRGLSRSKVYHPPRGPEAITQTTVDTTCPVVFLPPLFLILPNGSGGIPDSSK